MLSFNVPCAYCVVLFIVFVPPGGFVFGFCCCNMFVLFLLIFIVLVVMCVVVVVFCLVCLFICSLCSVVGYAVVCLFVWLSSCRCVVVLFELVFCCSCL